MIKLPGMTLLSILLTSVFALTCVLPEPVSANPMPPAAKVARSSRKSSRKKRSRQSSKCSPAAREAGKRQEIGRAHV